MAEKHIPQVIIIAGPNGAGKSTLAPGLLRDRLKLVEYINADTIAQGLAAFEPERVAIEAGRIMLKRMHELSSQRVSFAFETTLATRSYAPWLRTIIQQGCRLHLSFVWLRSPEMAVQRVRARVRDGGHAVPEETIRRRYVKGVRNFFELYQPLAATWALYDNSVAPKPVWIASGRGDRNQTIFQPELWSQFCEVCNARTTGHS
jgi:predicted ABC-type ATPase